jgi:hypothetical protein
VRGAWHTLFDGSYEGNSYSLLLILALVVLVVAVRARDDRRFALGAGVASGLLVLRWALGPDDSVTGLLVAWPVAVAGVLRAVRGKKVTPLMQGLGVAAALIVAAVLATQYEIGGGLEWGGRYLSPIAVPIAVIGAVGLATLGVGSRRAAAAAMAATAAMGIGILANLRNDHDRITTAIESRQPRVVVTDVRSLPRIGWRTDGKFAWWIVDDEGEVQDAVDDLQAAGRDGIVTVTSEGIRNIRSK